MVLINTIAMQIEGKQKGAVMERLTQTSNSGGVAFTFDLDITCQLSETIANEKELSEHCKRMFEEMSAEDKLANKLLKSEIQYHEQIVEWSEDLKAIKEMDLDIPQHFTKEQSDWIKAYCVRRNIEFYNKAIDDFVKFANTMPTVETEDGEIRPMWLEEMAEQLKAGGNNE